MIFTVTFLRKVNIVLQYQIGTQFIGNHKIKESIHSITTEAVNLLIVGRIYDSLPSDLSFCGLLKTFFFSLEKCNGFL